MNPDPHGAVAHGPMRATFRVMYYWCDFVLGTWFLVWPATLRGKVVIIERGWLDMAVDPKRYHLNSPRLVRFLAHLLPSVDLLAVLDIPSQLALERKTELPALEIDRQCSEWRDLKIGYRHKILLDATKPSASLAACIEDLIGGSVK